jgi:hypothetical protein
MMLPTLLLNLSRIATVAIVAIATLFHLVNFLG